MQAEVQMRPREIIATFLHRDPNMKLPDIAREIGVPLRTLQDNLKRQDKTTFRKLQKELLHPIVAQPPEDAEDDAYSEIISNPLPQTEGLTEDYTERYLLLCARSLPPSPQIATLLIQWVDKKKAITPAKSYDEDLNTNAEVQARVADMFRTETPDSPDPPQV